MRKIETNVDLPSGSLDPAVAERLFRLIIDEFRWVIPSHFGTSTTDEVLAGDAPAILRAYLAEHGRVVARGKGGEFLFLTKPERERPAGFFVWFTPESAARRPAWRARHVEETAAVAKLLRSPLAWAALEDDFRRKTYRSVPFGRLTKDVPRLRGSHEGLLALYWRNIFGPPFTAMFGDRLRRLPSDAARDLGDGYWLVQPYGLPGDALTDAGQRREAELIAQIGPEFFYDMPREAAPQRRPVLRSHAR